MVQLDILTLNIQSGQVWDKNEPDKAPVELDRAINFLKESPPDIFFLQEVEIPCGGFIDYDRHNNYDRLQKAFPSYQSYFGLPTNTLPHLPFGVGLAIFSKFPIFDSFHLVLPAADIVFVFHDQPWKPAERSVIGTFITVNGVKIQLVNTHLQAYFMIGSSSNDHPEQRTVLKTLLLRRHCPTILAGDFNCTANESTVADIESAGVRTVQKKEATWLREPLVLDHIFYSPEFRPIEHRIIDASVSDHCCLRASLVMD